MLASRLRSRANAFTSGPQAAAHDSFVPTVARTPSSSGKFAHDFSHVPSRAAGAPRIQAKLKVGAPGDSYEREADDVATKVKRSQEPRVQRSCAFGGSCGHCKRGGESAPSSVERVIRSSGEPLDSGARAHMQSHFGHDFGRVRVHRDAAAQGSARDVAARAYTAGDHIVFGAGEYAPHTDAGRHLLAHELTHVVQQAGAAPSRVQRLGAQAPGDASATAKQGAEQSGPEQGGEGDNTGMHEEPPRGGAMPLQQGQQQQQELQSPGGGGTGGGGGAGTTAEITLETGNTGAALLNNLVHQQICVDGYSSGGPKQCFSFAADGPQMPQFSSTWLGWSSTVVGAILHGAVYDPAPVPGATIASRLTPTPAQADTWRRYMTGTRLGLGDGYSLARHNCRTFSQWEFRDAPSHY